MNQIPNKLNIENITETEIIDVLQPYYDISESIWNITADEKDILNSISLINKTIESGRIHKQFIIDLINVVSEKRDNLQDSLCELYSRLNWNENFRFKLAIGSKLYSKGLISTPYHAPKNDNSNDEILKIFYNDDFEEFQKLISQSNFNMKMCIDNDKLIDVAAKHSSLRIFKFLILEKAEITDKTCINACIGGNLEIIRILSQQKAKFNDCYSKCIEYHHNDIADWLHMNHEVEMIKLIDCMKFCNFQAACFCIENGFDINAKDIEYKFTIPINLFIFIISSLDSFLNS